MPFGFSGGRTYHGPATDSYASRTGGRGQIGHGQVATAAQVLVGQRVQPVAHLVEGGEVGAVGQHDAHRPARPGAQHPRSLDLWQLDQLRAAAPRRTAAGPRSGASSGGSSPIRPARAHRLRRGGIDPGRQERQHRGRNLDLRPARPDR